VYDKFNRKINYLRVSVTDRCNLRCVYCMPAEGVQLMPHEEILSFSEIVETLADAGLHRVNVSLDTLDAVKYKKITRLGDINKVFKGIAAAKKAGLNPVKINCVISELSDESDTNAVAKYCKEHDLQVQYIEQMDLEKGSFSIVDGGTGGNCEICNRLRLTAKGDIMPCLFSDITYNVRQLGVEKAVELALKNKPQSGHHSTINKFYNIGG